MIQDLSDSRQNVTRIADVAIVGAGLAGLVMAVLLARQGRHVQVLESGPLSPQDAPDRMNEVELPAQAYMGASEGRFRGVGGTSTRWGGALLPFLPIDLDAHTSGWGPAWPVSHSDLLTRLPLIEGLFGLEPGPYEPEELRGHPGKQDDACALMLRSPKWPTFAARNVANLFSRDLHQRENLSVWCNAHVTRLVFDGARCTGLVAKTAAGRTLEVKAKEVVLAAGAIETTRLLLLQAALGTSCLEGSHLGRCFHDHLSAPIATISPVEESALNEAFAFRFVKGGMRNVRLEFTPQHRARNLLPGGFLHVSFAENREGGFARLRRILQSAQKRKLPDLRDAILLAGASPWLARAAYWRIAKKTVLAPAGARWEAHLVTEQAPHPDNQIRLSVRAVDVLGQPLAVIDWRVRPEDEENFLRAADGASTEWTRRGLDALGRLDRRTPDAIRSDLSLGGGIYHPAGSTRMASAASEGVVDANLRPFGTSGLRVVSTSVFPNCGGANPSLMLLLLAARCAEQLVEQVSS
jgi:choline dehydrogenase-like flavoprotein